MQSSTKAGLRCTSQEWSSRWRWVKQNPGPGAFLGLSFRLASDCYVSRPFWANFWSCCAIFFAMHISQDLVWRGQLVTSAESCQVPFVEDPLLLQGPDTCKKAWWGGVSALYLHSLLLNNRNFFWGRPKPPLPKSPVKILASLNWQQHLVFSGTTPGVK